MFQEGFRLPQLSRTGLALALLPVMAGPVMAQANPYNVVWSALSPGNDWTAQLIQSLFPVGGPGGAAGGGAIGAEATVIGTMLGQLTGAVMIVMVAFIGYGLIQQSVAAAETARVLGNRTNSWLPVRLVMAALMAWPVVGGFSTGHAVVSQVGLWGIGLARNLYQTGIQAIGPDAAPITQPIIPGSKKVVAGLMQAELCRALVNVAAGNPNLVPAPQPVTGVAAGLNGYVTWSYGLAVGDDSGAPICGTVTIRTTGNIGGVNAALNMSATEQTIVTHILQDDLRPNAEAVARGLWQDRQASSLNPMQNMLETATADYTTRLTQAATTITATLRGQFTTQAMRNGNTGGQDAQAQIAALGWSGAGAYYMEIGKLNGLTLSLLSATPTVSSPNWQGLGRYLSADLAPLVHAVAEFQDRLNTYIATTDPLDQPAGSADLFSGASPGDDGAGLLEKVTRRLGFSEAVLTLFTNSLSPTANNWADPFAALVKLGHGMILVALTALGAAGLMASATATTGMMAWNAITLNFGGVAAAFSGHLVMNFLGTPIFYGLMALLVPGLIIAFVLPMIPMLMWTMGILGWLILFCEAMVSVPLWAFAHVAFQGDGLHGRGLRGYGIVFNLLLRPSLMLFGLFLSYFCFAAISRLIFMTFSIASGFALAQGWLVSNLIGVVLMSAMFVLMHTVALIACFRMIALFPQHVPTWLGLDAADRLDTHSLAQDAGLIGLGATLREIRAGTTGGASKMLTGNAGQRALAGPRKESDASGPSGGGMDRTVAIATEASPPAQHEG